MRYATIAAVTLSLCAFAPLQASAFECPVAAAGAGVTDGAGLGETGKLEGAIASMRGKGVNNAMIVDGLIGAYCPAVAKNAALGDAAKRAAVRSFAARAVAAVYGLGSADAVILDVPLPPAVASAVNARAASQKITPEAWVAGAVERALKAAP